MCHIQSGFSVRALNTGNQMRVYVIDLPGISALPGFRAHSVGDWQSTLNPVTTVFTFLLELQDVIAVSCRIHVSLFLSMLKLRIVTNTFRDDSFRETKVCKIISDSIG